MNESEQEYNETLALLKSLKALCHGESPKRIVFSFAYIIKDVCRQNYRSTDEFIDHLSKLMKRMNIIDVDIQLDK